MSLPPKPAPKAPSTKAATPRGVKDTFDKALNHPATQKGWGAAKIAYAGIAALVGLAAAVIGLGVNLSADAGFAAARSTLAAGEGGRWRLEASAQNEAPNLRQVSSSSRACAEPRAARSSSLTIMCAA